MERIKDMATATLSLPEAVDFDTLDIKPSCEFMVCNHLLDDHRALNAFYEDQGYIFLRGVLNHQSVARARDEMLAVAARHGLVREGDPTAKWTGVPLAESMEESPEFAGVSKRLIEHPDNLALMEKILGEPACMVPNVQYRIYPPNGPVTLVHQDGFYSPGIQDYKPVWVPLVPCTKETGGLTVAVGQNKRGYFHNVAKPAPFRIPVGYIDEDSWATIDYQPGDVLIVHPYSPHAGLPNRSDRLRVSFDTRVQSAARPSAFAATVRSVTRDSITVVNDQGEQTFSVGEDTFIRVLDPGRREKFSCFAEYTKPGMRLIVVRDGARAVMLRKAAEG
jgi:ectoine hydroxylase-related dioxygenase (phytanoyl-CoA dioxygenase family)